MGNLSAWQVGGNVWIVQTDENARPMRRDDLLPIGSTILTVEQAVALKEQLVEALSDADSYRSRVASVASVRRPAAPRAES